MTFFKEGVRNIAGKMPSASGALPRPSREERNRRQKEHERETQLLFKNVRAIEEQLLVEGFWRRGYWINVDTNASARNYLAAAQRLVETYQGTPGLYPSEKVSFKALKRLRRARLTYSHLLTEQKVHWCCKKRSQTRQVSEAPHRPRKSWNAHVESSASRW